MSERGIEDKTTSLSLQYIIHVVCVDDGARGVRGGHFIRVHGAFLKDVKNVEDITEGLKTNPCLEIFKFGSKSASRSVFSAYLFHALHRSLFSTEN